MIFNGARREYMVEFLDSEEGKREVNEFCQWLRDHHNPQLEEHFFMLESLPLSQKDQETNSIIQNLKGDWKDEKYCNQLENMMDAIMEEMQQHVGSMNGGNTPETGITETDLMHKVIPESIGKTGQELKPYQTLFDDAMYILFKLRWPKGTKYKKLYDEWKLDHDYLEGR